MSDTMWQVVPVHLPVRDPARGGYERTIVHAGDFIRVATIRLVAARLAGQAIRYHNTRPITP